MSIQRLRGFEGALFHRHVVENARGARIIEPDFTRPPMFVRMGYSTLRTARNETPGQQTNEETYLSIPADDLDDVGPWSVAYYCGHWYDVTAPPMRHESRVRRMSHWLLRVKRRPPATLPGVGMIREDVDRNMDFAASFAKTNGTGRLDVG